MPIHALCGTVSLNRFVFISVLSVGLGSRSLWNQRPDHRRSRLWFGDRPFALQRWVSVLTGPRISTLAFVVPCLRTDPSRTCVFTEVRFPMRGESKAREFHRNGKPMEGCLVEQLVWTSGG